MGDAYEQIVALGDNDAATLTVATVDGRTVEIVVTIARDGAVVVDVETPGWEPDGSGRTCTVCDGNGINTSAPASVTKGCLCGGGRGPHGEYPCSICRGQGVVHQQADPRCPACDAAGTVPSPGLRAYVNEGVVYEPQTP